MAPADWALQLPGEPRNGVLKTLVQTKFRISMEDSAICHEAPSHRISSARKSSRRKVWLYF